jgi:hypothetical protein
MAMMNDWPTSMGGFSVEHRVGVLFDSPESVVRTITFN